MAKLKMLLKGNTTSLSFFNLEANDTINIVDTDVNMGITIDDASILHISKPSTSDFYVTLEADFTSLAFDTADCLLECSLIGNHSITDMTDMFNDCTSLVNIPELNTANVTIMDTMFLSCSSLTTVPLFDMSKVTSVDNMFSYCSKLSSIPLFNLSSLDDASFMFTDCTALTTVPPLDFSNTTIMSGTFSGCTALTTVPKLNTSSVNDMSMLFNKCTALTNISELDISMTSDLSSSFGGCTSLKSIKLKGLTADLYLDDSPLLDSDSIKYILNNVQNNTNNFVITLNAESPAYKNLYINDESYINAINKGWIFTPEVTKIPNPFKVVYADTLDKYNQLTDPDPNTMYIIGEGNNEMIIFNNQLVSNKGIKLERI